MSAECGFISDPGGALVTMLVANVAPYGVVFTAIADGKGSVPVVVRQLGTWIQECGLVKFTYRTDREHAMGDLLKTSVRESGRHGTPIVDEEDQEDVPALSRLESPMSSAPHHGAN